MILLFYYFMFIFVNFVFILFLFLFFVFICIYFYYFFFFFTFIFIIFTCYRLFVYFENYQTCQGGRVSYLSRYYILDWELVSLYFFLYLNTYDSVDFWCIYEYTHNDTEETCPVRTEFWARLYKTLCRWIFHALFCHL